MEKNISPAQSPDAIMQIGLGFWPSKILLTAVSLDLFTTLSKTGGSTAADLKKKFGLGCTDRHWFDFLDALTGFHFLERQGLLENAVYKNNANTDLFLDKTKPT